MAPQWLSAAAVLTWLLAVDSIPQNQAFSQTPFRAVAVAPPSRSVVSYRAQDEDTPPILKEEPEQEEQEHSFSKTKWKKKRYVMMKDVDDYITLHPEKAARKAHEMIRRMTRLYQKTGIEDYKPAVEAYNLWIHALAKSGASAEFVLQEMRDARVEPNSVSYTCVIDAQAKSGHKHAAQDAERLFLEFLDQDVDLHISSVDAVLNALAIQGSLESALRAEIILERFTTLPTTSMSMQPTVHSYSTVMNAFAKCGAAERAHAILRKVLEKGNVQVDTVMFNVVINAWAASGDAQAGSKAVELLKQMEQLDIEPDIVTYNSVLSAWSKSGHINAGPQAERILKQLQGGTCSVTPNVVSYNSVLHAWSCQSSQNPDAAARAQAVLDYMIDSPDIIIHPDVYSFTSVLNAWAKSKEPDKAVRARQLLDRLLKLHNENPKKLQLSAIPFNTVLNACAFSPPESSQRPALQIAVSTFNQIPSYTLPDTISYGNLLKCCTNLMPSGKTRTEMALHIFEKCCNAGLVGDLVWNEVRKAVPSQTLAKLASLGQSVGMSSSLQQLPQLWRRNCRDKQAIRTKRRNRTSPKKDEPIKPIRPVGRAHVIVEKSYESGRDL
jgi:hypothetical protein